MSVENPENAANNDIEVKPQNGEQDQRFNGLSNGHIESSSSHHKHKSSSKDKHRDKDRDHKSSKSHSSSGRDKDSEKHKSSSSNDKDKHRDKERSDKERSDKDKDRHRDKDKSKDKNHHRDREKDRDKHKSSSSSHHKSSSSSHHKSSSSHDKEKNDKEKNDKDRDKEKERTKDKDREHGKNRDGEHGKDKERDKERDKDKERNKDKEKHRDKDKERSKDKTNDNSGDREKDRKKEHKSSSHSKDHRDRERSDRDKDRHHKTSSSSKDKHSSSSSSKHRDKDKEKHSSSSSKDKERHRDKERKEKNGTVENRDNVDNKLNIIKTELEPPRNDYDQSCSGFPHIKDENNIKMLNVPSHPPEISMNFSQASSCDYSMSQFRDDEPAFVVKEEMPAEDAQEMEDENHENDESAVKSEPDEYVENDNDDDEDIPLANRKRKQAEESDDDIPLGNRKKIKTEKKKEKIKEKKAKKKKREEIEEDYLDEKPKKKKIKKEKVEPPPPTQQQRSPMKGGKKKKEEQPDDVWKWWEEEKREDGVKWTFLEHKGPVFAPPYEPLPNNVHFYYDGKIVKLCEDAEEIASFYAKMLTHDYVTKKQFNDNFFKDWRRSMTSKERELIRNLDKCNFKQMNEYFTALSEKRKQMSKEEKQAIKKENERLIEEYGYCIIDGHKQRIGNFKLEPPGLFRGRGEHPKMGLVKKRLMPEDVLINCSKDSKIPVPPKGHKWKEVRHDNTVTWLASWTENIQGQVKYIMLNPSSKLKGEKDYQKYEVARRLDKHIDKIRATYREEWKSKEMRIRQRGVALYFIDKLALRAGNEKDEDQADTVGCCSLRVEHVKLHKELNGKENVVEFDFLGKDSIRYYNQIEVEKRVFKNLELFMENKKEGDDLFDRLNTQVLNEHLRELMEGLTAKVFRTYNASITLQQQLDLLTDPDASVPEKLLAYNRANRAVAILCNHQRSIPKSHEKSMENLKEKIKQRQDQLDDAETELRDLQKLAKRGSVKEKLNADKKKKQVERLREQLKKLELQQTDRDENKTIALGTSKLNYLDPRISVAWCKKHGVPVEKIYNKTQREKFRWAIDMADEDYRF